MRKVTTLVLFTSLFLTFELKAQFNVDWANDYAHTSTANFSNEGRKVAIDTLNGFVYTLSDVTSDLSPGGVVTGLTYSYTVLTKYNTLGSLIESVVIDVGQHTTSGFDQKSGFGLQVDNTGNVFIGYMNYNAVTSYDVNLAKYDILLNLVWNYKFNAVTEDLGIAMEVNSGTAYAILKSTSGTNIRHRIIKANAAGTSATPLYTYSAQPDFLTDLVVDGTQKIYMTGYRLVGGVKNILMSCVNNAGTLLWSRVDNCGTVSGDDFARDITLGVDDYLYITGQSQGTVQHGIDVVIMKFNPLNGKKVWETFINYNLTDGGFFIINPDFNYAYISWVATNTIYIDQVSAFTGAPIRRISYIPTPVAPHTGLSGATITDMKMSKRQNIYITGGIGGINSGQNFTAAYLIRASFASRGLPQVQYSLPVTGDPAQNFKGLGIALDEDESQLYLLEDQFNTYLTHANEAVWLASLNVSGVLRTQQNSSSFDETELLIETWPNPVSSEVHVRSNKNLSRIEIADVNGKIFLSQPVQGSTETRLDVSTLAAGVYFVKIFDENGFSNLTKISK